jgi:hypothetical protein
MLCNGLTNDFPKVSPQQLVSEPKLFPGKECSGYVCRWVRTVTWDVSLDAWHSWKIEKDSQVRGSYINVEEIHKRGGDCCEYICKVSYIAKI